MRRPDERGAAALEFAVLAPVLVLLLGLAVATGRLALAKVSVHQWADSAARTASIARGAAEARQQALAVVAADARRSGVVCFGGPAVEADTAGFAVPVGRPAHVEVRVTCHVRVADLVPGLPGSIALESRATSTLDRHRGRQ